MNELVNKWNAVGERLGESIDNQSTPLTIETPFNLANFQLEDSKHYSNIFYDIDSINDINRNINIEVIKYHSLKESVQSGEPRN